MGSSFPTRDRTWVPCIGCVESYPLDNQGSPHFFMFYYFLIIIIILKIYLFYLFLAALGLCCCARAFSSCGEQGLLFIVVRGLLIASASLVAEHGL